MADVRVTDLPAATSLASGDVLHGVQAADTQDKRFTLSDLAVFFGAAAPVDSVFGRTGAVVAVDGDYNIDELGDVDLSVAPVLGQFLKWDGSNWIADDVPADVVDLGYTTAASTGTITNTAGTNATIPAATTSLAGLFTASDTTKLDGIAAGAEVNVDTNLGYTTAASTGTVTSSTGTNATIPAATTSLAGLLTGSDKTKLDGIASGAQPGTVTSIATSSPLTGGTITTSGTIGIQAASTSQSGAVQLNNTTSSTSTTEAATANAVKSANDNANTRLALAGGTLTGGVYQTVRTITSGAAWDLSTGNFWEFAGGTIANPTNATAGMSGLIRVTDPISGWGTNFDFPGATPVAPATFPALIPWYVSATNVIMIGTSIEGIT